MEFPNTFIIGVQKAGTTTLHDWLVQHPDVYSPKGYKDIDFLTNPERSDNSKELLRKAFMHSSGADVLLQSCVNYIFFPEALLKLKNLFPESKLIVVLRSPIDRAFSAFRYMKKMGREKRNLKEAMLYEPVSDLSYSLYNCDFTYIEHGMYYRQLQKCYEYFERNQVLVVDFDDLRRRPDDLLRNIYGFLNIRDNFLPDFKPRNVTGEVRFGTLQRCLTQSNSVRKWVLNNLVDFWLPQDKRRSLKEKLMEINTKPRSSQPSEELDGKQEVIEHFREIFLKETRQLDRLLQTNYVEKWGLE